MYSKTILLGKQPISFLPNHPKKKYTVLPVEISLEFHDIDAILSHLETTEDDAAALATQHATLQQFSKTDHCDKEIISSIEELSSSTHGLTHNKKLSERDKWFIRTKDIINFIFRRLSPFERQKQQGFSPEFVTNYVETYTRNKPKVKVNWVSKDYFTLEAE